MSLYICATPIGNLDDTSCRLYRVLKECSVVLAEDTRRTGKLLAHFSLSTPMSSFHEHSRGKIPAIIASLKEGKDIALVTDNGTPGISDPGGLLVAEAHRVGISVVPVPGPSAITTALSVCGMDANQFSFFGFPPKKGRENFFSKTLSQDTTIVFYESPYRVMRTLEDIARLAPDRRVAACRELTKVHEEIVTGTALEILARWTGKKPKGEFVIVVEKAPGRRKAIREEN